MFLAKNKLKELHGVALMKNAVHLNFLFIKEFLKMCHGFHLNINSNIDNYKNNY